MPRSGAPLAGRDRLIVGLCVLGLLPALVHLGTLESSETATVEQLVSPARADEVRRQRALFGAESDLLLLSLSVTSGRLDPARIEELERVVATTPGVAHVLSPASRPRLALSEPGPRVTLVRGAPPSGRPSVLDGFLQPDAATGHYVVTLGPASATLSGTRQIVGELTRRVQARLRPSERWRAVGFPALRVESWEQARRDVRRIVPWLALAALAVPFAFFRSIWAALFPLLLGGLATATTLGLYALVRGGLEPWALALIPVVWAVATMDTMHLYQGAIRRARGLPGAQLAAGSSAPDAVSAAARELAAPCLVTAAVTAASLLSLAAPGGPPLLSVFGVWGAIGTFVAFALSFLVGPPLLRLAVARSALEPAGARAGALPAEATDRFARRCVALSQRRASWVVAAWLSVSLVAAWALPHLETTSSYEQPFVADAPFSRDLAAVRASTGSGLVPLEIYLEPTAPRRGDARGLMTASIALYEYLSTLPDTRVALSAAALVSELITHDPLAPALKRRLRRGSTLDDGLGEIVRDPRLSPWVAPDLSATRTVLLLRPTTHERRAELRRWIEHFVDTVLEGYAVGFGGVGYWYESAEADGRAAVGWGLLGDLGLLTLVLALVLRRARLVVAGLLGNVVPVLCLGGLMVLAGVPWSLGLLGLPILVLGLAADDTIHLLWKARRRSTPLPIALSLAYRRFGSAALATSLLLAACLASLSGSGLAASRQLGWLVPAGILLALAAELTLVPASIRLLRGRLRARRRR